MLSIPFLMCFLRNYFRILVRLRKVHSSHPLLEKKKNDILIKRCKKALINYFIAAILTAMLLPDQM